MMIHSDLSHEDCLLASGASESETFIWDLNNPASPVILGAKTQVFPPPFFFNLLKVNFFILNIQVMEIYVFIDYSGRLYYEKYF